MKFKVYNPDGQLGNWVYYNSKDEPIKLIGDFEMMVESLSLCYLDNVSEVEVEIWDEEPCIDCYQTLKLKSVADNQAFYEEINEGDEVVFPLEMIQEISDPIPEILYMPLM